MPQEVVDPDTFLARLTACFGTPSTSSSSYDPTTTTPSTRSSKGKGNVGAGASSAAGAGTSLGEERKGGSVWLTHKRLPREHASSTVIPTQPTNDDMDVDVEAGDASAGDYDVLIRCTDGVDINFSTKIPSSLLSPFLNTYTSLLKSYMAPHMRRRDKKKEKLKAEAREKKRKEVFEDVDLGRLSKRIRAKERAVRTKGAAGQEEKGAGSSMEVDGGETQKKRNTIKRVGHRQRKRILAAQFKKETERSRLEERDEKQRKGLAGELVGSGASA